MSEFLVCGRCSFFLTGYRVIHGGELFQNQAVELENDLLSLAWSYETGQLLQKSYGFDIDGTCIHFEGQCPECLRRIVYSESTESDLPATFLMELKSP